MAGLSITIWLLAGVVWLVWGLNLVWPTIRPAWYRYHAWRRDRLDDRARWVVYRDTDSDTGRITIGLELITPDGRRIGDVEIHKPFKEDTPDEVLFNATSRALLRADVLNTEQTPERRRMYRQQQDEIDREEEE